MDLLAADLNVLTLPPGHVLGLLQQVVTHPAGDRHHRGVLLNEVLLPANLHQHALHLVGHLIISGLLVPCRVAVHLVHTDADLLHAEQIDQAGVLTRLALNLASLVVAFGNGRGEVSVGGHHDQGHIGLGRTGDHVLDEVAVARGVDHGVLDLGGLELPQRDVDGDAALALGLELVKDPGVLERGLAHLGGLLLELLDGTLVDATALVDQVAGGGGLAGIYVADHHKVSVDLLLSHG
mmetsp:Transcript_122098/g.171846  ORF Transcript_122098/g.171846 Transcript_122098/m.171846 type:complete len:237 (+) Transcript_122098:808-1518(+)